MAQHYAVSSLAEARAYLEHPVLGPRLHEAARLALESSGAGSADDVFGGIDAIKLRSSMTLFLRADPTKQLFQRVLDAYFNGSADESTDGLLAN